MKKRQPKKITLNRETLVNLSTEAMTRAAGGTVTDNGMHTCGLSCPHSACCP
jgi:hypothetical protein